MTDKADVQKALSLPRSDDLQSAVAAAAETFRAANPKSFAQHSAATAVMPGGSTRTVLYHDPFPVLCENSAEGGSLDNQRIRRKSPGARAPELGPT